MKIKKLQLLSLVNFSINCVVFASHLDMKHSNENALQKMLRTKAAAQQSNATTLPLKKAIPSRRSFDLRKPIPPIFTRSCEHHESEKIALFEQAILERPSRTLRLYQMAHDPIIKAHIRNTKRVNEFRTLVDAQRKSILRHVMRHS
jgi:hypothetical protein